MDIAALQTALRVWVKAASGLDDNHVIWSEQASVKLTTPFITMRLGDLVPLGAVDEKRSDYDPLGAPGAEMVLSVVGRRELAVSVQCFGAGCLGILSAVQTKIRLDSINDPLNTAGLSPFEIGTVQNLTELQETVFEPRALVEVKFYLAETASETTTFIEKVEVENDITSPPTNFVIGES